MVTMFGGSKDIQYLLMYHLATKIAQHHAQGQLIRNKKKWNEK